MYILSRPLMLYDLSRPTTLASQKHPSLLPEDLRCPHGHYSEGITIVLSHGKHMHLSGLSFANTACHGH